MAHHHDHAHHHHGADVPAPGSHQAAFAIGALLNLGFAVTELGVGFFANSLALISDALHNFSDVIGLLLAWGAAWLATWRPTASHTYGYRRVSILAALGNAALLFAATGAILTEAVRRLLEPEPIAAGLVLWVAAIGIAINLATALLFMRGRHHDLNIRGAFLHMAGDAAVSLGVVVAALLIGWTGWLWLDPAVSLMVAAVILATTWGLTRDAVNLAVDAVPAGIDRHAVETYLAGLPGVTEVHDLHIWAMSTTETALTVHLVRPNAGLDDHLLTDACHTLEHRFGIHHATIQIEAGVHACRLARITWYDGRLTGGGSMHAGTALLIFVTLQRFTEFIWDRQNTARLIAAGAVEHGTSHYVFFAGTHAAWLAGLWALGWARAVEPIWLVPFALLTIGRYWVMGTLGRRWTTRIVVLAGAPLIKTGPYRFVRHPNYIVVIGEMVVVPLALGLPAFALAFFAIYAYAATIRIRAENDALLKALPPRESRQYAKPAAE